jgi:hypothetical protein
VILPSLYRLFSEVEVRSTDINIPKGNLDNDNIAAALKLAFGVAGGIALVIVTLAGFKYVLSQGNPQETAKAKNTILYALIGLVVCLFAFGIVSFVITNTAAP